MSNTITIELCAEDRARIDKLTQALEARVEWEHRNCHLCVKSALETSRLNYEDLKTEKDRAGNFGTETVEEPKDELQERLANTIKEAAEFVGADRTTTSAEPQESPAPTDTSKAEQKPTDEEKTAPSTTKTVDRAELRAKVIEVSAKGLKEQAREIVKAYAPTVAAVPEDKITECYEKLAALED